MRGPQDYGGLPAGPINPVKHEHVPNHWEKTVDALMMLIFDQRRQLARVDESRRMQEAFGEDYHKYPYYERWLQAVSWLMLEKSVFTQEELDAKQVEVRARLEAERDEK
jgi:hypothetical protein